MLGRLVCGTVVLRSPNGGRRGGDTVPLKPVRHNLGMVILEWTKVHIS